MMRSTSLLLSLALTTLGAGCNLDPLIGTWTMPFTVGTFNGTESFELNADRTIVVTASGAGVLCSGSFVTTGLTWEDTPPSITFAGTPTCTGALVCAGLALGCSNSDQIQAGSCTYALSDHGDTVTLTDCSGMQDGTLTRTP